MTNVFPDLVRFCAFHFGSLDHLLSACITHEPGYDEYPTALVADLLECLDEEWAVRLLEVQNERHYGPR